MCTFLFFYFLKWWDDIYALSALNVVRVQDCVKAEVAVLGFPT